MRPHLRVLYRADGGHRIGTGHLLRAVRVLNELETMVQLSAVLAMSEDPDGLRYAEQAPARVLLLPASETTGPKPRFDPLTLTRATNLDDFDVVVVDMLDTDVGTLACLGSPTRAVITMDDRGPGRVDADAIINFLVREPQPQTLPARVRLFEGPQFVTLDSSYSVTTLWRRARSRNGATILVTLGGGDAAGLTVKVARALLPVEDIGRVDFVCGLAFQHRQELDELLRRAPWRTCVHIGVPSLLPYFLGCQMAIVAGGMTMHEACCTGTPAIAVCQSIDHQLELAEWFAAEGAMINLGDGQNVDETDIRDAVVELLRDASLRRRMGMAGRRLVDGKGTRRTAEAIWETVLSKRKR